MNVPDDYEYLEPELIEIFTDRIGSTLDVIY